MRKIDVLLDAYDAHYQTHWLRTVHFVCAPMLLFGFFGLVYSIPIYTLFTSIFEPSVTKHINLATVLLIAITLYYLSLSVKLALGMLLLLLLALALIHLIELSALTPLWIMMAIVFVSAWVGLLLAHRHESKGFSCRTSVRCLFLGPLWMLKLVYRRLGVRI